VCDVTSIHFYQHLTLSLFAFLCNVRLPVLDASPNATVRFVLCVSVCVVVRICVWCLCACPCLRYLVRGVPNTTLIKCCLAIVAHCAGQ
jgi:hypothetical protein